MDWQIVEVPRSITKRHMRDFKSRRVAIRTMVDPTKILNGMRNPEFAQGQPWPRALCGSCWIPSQFMKIGLAMSQSLPSGSATSTRIQWRCPSLIQDASDLGRSRVLRERCHGIFGDSLDGPLRAHAIKPLLSALGACYFTIIATILPIICGSVSPEAPSSM